MKITFLMPSYTWAPSGGFRVVYEYANRLASRGHEMTVVHPRRLKYLSPERLTPYRWARRKTMYVRDSFLTPAITWQLIDKEVRVLFVADSDSTRIPDGDAIFATAWHTVRSVLACPPTKGTKFYLIQGYETWQGPKGLVDATWRSPLHKVVVSKWLRGLGEELGCQDMTYIPNAVNHEIYRLSRAIEDRPRQLAMVFSAEQIKGSADGIVALEIVKRRFPDLKAVFFGTDRHRRSIPAWVQYYRTPPQHFIIHEIYNNSGVFLSPSWAEGFALPPAEAACCGCAVVATDSGGIREFIHHGVTGLLSPARDPKALAENLCLLLENDSLRVQLAKACNSFVRRLSWDKSADLLQDFIKGVTNHRSHMTQAF
jgi:glycosyltransferase involved in cell wall biosynthesis